MKTKTLTKIAIASAICAPSCAVERGVIVERQDLAEEKAFYVNLVQRGGANQTNSDGTFEADRKLFFMDSTYGAPFIYADVGDTIVFKNPARETFVEINAKNRVISVNGMREKVFVKWMNKVAEPQK